MTVLGFIVVPACRRQPQSRHYVENVVAAAPAPELSPAPPPVRAWRWAKPSHWQEQGSSGLRLATFAIADRGAVGRCSIVPLSGDGGGVEANVRRWLEQLHMTQISSTELDVFLGQQKKMQTSDGLPVMVIDFTMLVRAREPAEESMMVAIIMGENQTLFVKMDGRRDLLEKNREVFYEFSRSISRGA
jgi:hypothetical protein